MEIWNYHAGAPPELLIHTDETHTVCLGPELLSGQRPQGSVPPYAWQSARSLGDWTLVGCVVTPGFRFSGFELAPAGWAPPSA